MDFDQELRQVARQYEEDGYVVVLRPGPESLPTFATDYPVDLIAKKGDQGVLVEVRRNRADLSDSPKLSELADVTNGQANWRFDVVVVEPENSAMKLARGAAEPTIDQIGEMLDQAEKLTQAGAATAACVIAWAGFEAAMRRVRPPGRGATPTVLLRSIYAAGDISRDEFSLLDEAYRFRNQVVHGFVPIKFDNRLVTEIIRIARHLLTEEPLPERAKA